MAEAVYLTVATVMKHITKLADKQLIIVERTSCIDNKGMKWNRNINNQYTILPIQTATDHCYQQQMPRAKRIWQSMSRKGNCLDNAVVENFFGRLKSELFYLQRVQSMEQFKQELVAYLAYYNTKRIKLCQGGLPPAVYREKMQSIA